jgi:hypothetical protein
MWKEAHMSYSLRIEDGDLAVTGSQLDLVYGVDKLNQDLGLWLRERYGGDRFHTNYGSILQEFVGGVVGDAAKHEVQSEVLRVLQNYQAVQYRTLQQEPSKMSQSELLAAVDDIKTSVSYDTVLVQLRFRNGINQSSTLAVGTSA